MNIINTLYHMLYRYERLCIAHEVCLDINTRVAGHITYIKAYGGGKYIYLYILYIVPYKIIIYFII